MITPKSFINKHFKGLTLTLTAICLLGTSLAGQTPTNSHTATTGALDATGGAAITNQATLSYTFAGTTATPLSSNIVTTYVNQIDSYYMSGNDTGLAGTTVYSTRDVITGAGASIAISNSIVNVSNGPITLTLGLDAKGALTSALTPVLSIAAPAFKSTVGYYAFTSTTNTVTNTAGVYTIVIPQGVTANLTVTVTPPAGTAAGGWDVFTTTLTDATTAGTVNSGNATNFTVTKYVSTFAGLDTQATSEIDIAGGANFGKLQLLDSTCGGTAFATTSVSGNVRTTASVTGFPTSIVWVSGLPATGTVGLAPVSANPAECIVYQILVNNPLSTASITGAAITDTLGSGVTFVPGAGVGKTVLTPAGAGTPATTGAPGVTGMSIPALGTVTLQYEAKVN